MKLALYHKSVMTLQGLVIAAPFLSKLFDLDSPVPFPPLGDSTTQFRFVAMLIVGVSIALPFALPIKRVRSWLALGLFFSIVMSFALYLKLEQEFVVPIPFAATEEHPDGARKFVTRGNQRSPDLIEPFASMKDDELIRNTGLSDIRLEHAYTKESLAANREKLFWTYVLSLVCLEIFLGVIAKTEERSTRSRATP